MPLSLQELQERLSVIEPTEEMYAGLGEDDLPALEQMLQFEEPWLAARAVFAIGRIGGDRTADALNSAAEDRRPEVRVAAAATAGQVPSGQSDALLSNLMADDDPAVRRVALHALPERAEPRVLEQVGQLAESDPVPLLRDEAREILEKWNRGAEPEK
jgi:HEAT repeat protein